MPFSNGSMFLTKDGTTPVGTEKEPIVDGGWFAYGDPSDLWGTTWTAAEINSINFGVLVRVGDAAAASNVADACRITVYYELPVVPVRPDYSLFPKYNMRRT